MGSSRRQTLALQLKKGGLTILLIGVVFLLLQYLLRWGTDYYLRERAGVPVRIGQLFINPATGRVSLSLAGAKPGQVLKLDLGAVRFDWWTVVRKRLRLGQVRLEGLNLAIERDPEGALTIGGIQLASSASSSGPMEPQAPPSKSTWGVGIGGVDIRNVHVDYKDPLLKLSVLIRELHVDPAESWNPNQETPFHADLELNGGRLQLSGRAKPFLEKPELDFALAISALPLDWLGPMAKRPGLAGDFTGIWRVEGLEVRPSTSTPTVAIKSFSLKDARLSVADRSLKPPFRWAIQSLDFAVKEIDTADLARHVTFDLLAKISRYENVALKGSWAPLAVVPDGTVALQIDGFNGAPFTPFVEQAIGYRLATGLIDLKLDTNVQKGLLKMDSALAARRLYFERLKTDELDSSTEQLGLPLNLCLALLRDADDTIRLAVPVSGDLRDPKVPVGRLVWQILGKALAASVRAAATAFFPAGDRMGFDPIVFAPGQAVLTPEATANLAKVGEKLAQRPAVTLRVQGIAVPGDWYALKGKPLPNPAVPLNPSTFSPKENEHLLALASRREETLRAYFVETHHLDPKRLPGSAPRIDPDLSAPARAVLSF